MNRIYIFLFFMITSLNLLAQMRPGQTAADLSLPDVNGVLHSLSALKGKVVLVDFWASWCGPCRHNNPRLVKLYNKYHSKGLEIYGISLDEEKESWTKAVEHDKLTWLQLIDLKGWEAPSAAQYGVDAIPASFLIDQQGTIRVVNAEGSELENAVKDLLKQKTAG